MRIYLKYGTTLAILPFFLQEINLIFLFQNKHFIRIKKESKDSFYTKLQIYFTTYKAIRAESVLDHMQDQENHLLFFCPQTEILL